MQTHASVGPIARSGETAIFQSLVPGDHVLVARVCYWGVRKWLAEFGLTGGSTWSSSTRPTWANCGARSARPVGTPIRAFELKWVWRMGAFADAA